MGQSNGVSNGVLAAATMANAALTQAGGSGFSMPAGTEEWTAFGVSVLWAILSGLFMKK